MIVFHAETETMKQIISGQKFIPRLPIRIQDWMRVNGRMTDLFHFCANYSSI